MSSENRNLTSHCNEEIVDELTKDLNDCCVGDASHTTNKQEHSSDNHNRPLDTTIEPDVLKDAEQDSESEEEKPKEPNDLNDYINEEELKEIDNTLTDEQKVERHNSALKLKDLGNAAHKINNYLDAVNYYTEALRLCPLKNQNDRSILYSNRAASKIQLKYKKSALDDCTKAIELNPNYVRAYLRRAKLYEETDKLDECLEDYKKVIEFDPGNPDALKATVRLPPLINERNEKMKTEMLGKLKDLGNMILKPFGLSTNNFKLQDTGTGGYTINFQQNS